jgi:hypothetical protein
LKKLQNACDSPLLGMVQSSAVHGSTVSDIKREFNNRSANADPPAGGEL